MFESLTYDEQLQRLTAAAQIAASQFALANPQVTPLLYLHNAVFSVQAAHSSYTLRLSRPGARSDAWLRSELAWLEAINRETSLCVPRPLRTATGDSIALARVEGLDQPVRCTLLSWIEGTFLTPEQIGPQQAQQLGGFLGELHRFSATYQPAPDLERPRLDWEGLFGDDSQYNPGTGAAIFTPEQITVFDAVAEKVRVTMQTLGEAPVHFGLIHADFIAKNTLFHGDTVCAIDFDNCSFGYYLYDLAPPLLQWSDSAQYAELKAALWSGYNAIRPLPAAQQAHLETFVAARHVASCRWIASNLSNPKVRERAPQIIQSRVAELREYLQTGRVERRSEML